MKKKVTNALFSMVAGRNPTASEIQEVRRLVECLGLHNRLWHCLANGIPAAIYGAILEVVQKVQQSSISAVEARGNSMSVGVREDICERFADIERNFDCPAKSLSPLFDPKIWPRKHSRQRTNPLTYKQRHLEYKMRQKKNMKRLRFAQA